MSEFSAIILAAGKGTRMKSDICKVMHKICSKPLVEWVYEKCIKAGSERNVIVVGHQKEQIISYMGSDKIYVNQDKCLGTGHAVMCASGEFENYNKTVVVLSGDAPLISEKLIRDAVEFHEKTKSSATVISAVLDNPFGYGRIVRSDDNSLLKIVEQKDATEQEKKVCEINSGMYCFNSADLFEALKNIGNNNAQGEYYLTDTIAVLRSQNKKVSAFIADNPNEILGINDRIDLSNAQKIKNDEILKKHMLNGVTIINPLATYIDDEVEIGKDTIIYPNSFLKGNTKIGKQCEIGPNADIFESVIGDKVVFLNSVAVSSSVGDETSVGPFAYLRPNSNVGKHVKVGDFVEIKNSQIGDGTKISHLTYIGDSDVGKNINFGCGTITVNYDGKSKFRTKIEDGAFIGCNSNLIAPVTIKKNAFIAAGSTITDDVEENSLAIARSRQTNKSDWRKSNK